MHYMPNQIAKVFASYFRSIFQSNRASNASSSSDPLVYDTTHPVPEDFTYSSPDKHEIWLVLNDMKRNSSPGPDGFNVEFYLATWAWTGDDVHKIVVDFFASGVLPPQASDTHTVLIPKKLVPLVPADFRPISLCNVIYKIISKCIANRLKPHLPDYIHPSQQAFIEGRRISDNIIVAQEISHSFQLARWKHKAFMLKIDLAKAFDRLEWNFIAAALARKGLHGHFIKLVHACVSSPHFLVIINGQAFESFISSRGIRQDCPLSPYLFILAINELSISLGEALSANQLADISLGPNCPPIHSLLFADDLLICGHASLLEAQSMKRVLMAFCHNSGQMPNWAKSGLLFSRWVDDNTKLDIQNVFPVPLIDESFIHLGHPLVLPAKNRSEAYDFVLQKFRNKLITYKANSLSHATRVELTNSVFAYIPIYYMSNILFSKKFIAKINAIIRTFWWTGISSEPSSKALCLAAWKTFARQKQKGPRNSKYSSSQSWADSLGCLENC
jgi:hypothetical protein